MFTDFQHLNIPHDVTPEVGFPTGTVLELIKASASLRLIRTSLPNFTKGILRWHTHARIVLVFNRRSSAASGTVINSFSIPYLAIS